MMWKNNVFKCYSRRSNRQERCWGNFFRLLFFTIVGAALLIGCKQHNETPPVCPTGVKGEWEYLGLAGETISVVAIHPTDPQIIFAGSLFDFSEGHLAKLFRSKDCGQTWDTLIIANSSFDDIIFDPVNPDIIYGSPYHVIKSIDGGDTWMEVGDAYFSPFESVASLAIDPLNSNTLYVGTGETGVGDLYKSTDGGQSWSSVATNPKLSAVNSGLAFSTDGTVLYAASAEGYVLKTSDGGVSWDTTMTIPGRDFLQHMSVDKSNRIFTANVFAGLWFSDDQGQSWHNLDRNLVSPYSWSIGVRETDGMLITGGYDANNGWGIYKMGADSLWQKFGIDSIPIDYSYPKFTFSADYKYLFYGPNGLYRYRFP